MRPDDYAVRVRWLGAQSYADVLADMQQFTQLRTADTADELWVVEHPAVYTLGIRGGHEHLLHTGDIPVVQSDRGGQVTYHGPGQLVVYPLLDLARLCMGMRGIITVLEQALVTTLAHWGIAARPGKLPGLFVDDRKIASIGMRMLRRCTYHGLALNVCNDLAPFRGIHPCGQPGLSMTSIEELSGAASVQDAGAFLVPELLAALCAAAPHHS